MKYYTENILKKQTEDKNDTPKTSEKKITTRANKAKPRIGNLTPITKSSKIHPILENTSDDYSDDKSDIINFLGNIK